MKKYTQGLPFFPIAVGYRRSADILESLEKERAPLEYVFPIYFLYSHAAELFLKAFLRLNGMSIAALAKKPYGHNLVGLYKKCNQYALGLSEIDKRSLVQLLPLLAQGHDDYQFRYFEKSFNTADLSWIRESVSKLADAIEAAVNKERDIWEQEAKAAGMQLVPVPHKLVMSLTRG